MGHPSVRIGIERSVDTPIPNPSVLSPSAQLSFPFRNPLPEIPELVVDLTHFWPHHIYRGPHGGTCCSGNDLAGAISFVFRILPASSLNSKILASSAAISLIPKDSREGGGGHSLTHYDVPIPPYAHIKANRAPVRLPGLRGNADSVSFPRNCPRQLRLVIGGSEMLWEAYERVFH